MKELTRIISRHEAEMKAEIERLQEEMQKLKEALVKAAMILEALHLSVKWELAEDIKAQIADTLPLVHQALFHDQSTKGEQDES